MNEKLNQRTNKFTIVLNDNELLVFKNCRHILSKFLESDLLDVNYIACIKHDRDFDEEMNHVKTLHYHVVLELNKICRLGTILNWISSNFHCNDNQVTIDKCSSLPMQTRYLLHLDDFDKCRYYESDVVTNNKDYFDSCINLVIVRDLHDLIARVKEYHYDLEVIMSKIVHYDKWRKYINDLIINHSRLMR